MIDILKIVLIKNLSKAHSCYYEPGDKPEKNTAKEMSKEQKATGGRVGRKFGGGMDMGRRKTNVQKIKETFSPKKSKNKKFKTS